MPEGVGGPSPEELGLSTEGAQAPVSLDVGAMARGVGQMESIDRNQQMAEEATGAGAGRIEQRAVAEQRERDGIFKDLGMLVGGHERLHQHEEAHKKERVEKYYGKGWLGKMNAWMAGENAQGNVGKELIARATKIFGKEVIIKGGIAAIIGSILAGTLVLPGAAAVGIGAGIAGRLGVEAVRHISGKAKKERGIRTEIEKIDKAVASKIQELADECNNLRQKLILEHTDPNYDVESDEQYVKKLFEVITLMQDDSKRRVAVISNLQGDDEYVVVNEQGREYGSDAQVAGENIRTTTVTDEYAKLREGEKKWEKAADITSAVMTVAGGFAARIFGGFAERFGQHAAQKAGEELATGAKSKVPYDFDGNKISHFIQILQDGAKAALGQDGVWRDTLDHFKGAIQSIETAKYAIAELAAVTGITIESLIQIFAKNGKSTEEIYKANVEEAAKLKAGFEHKFSTREQAPPEERRVPQALVPLAMSGILYYSNVGTQLAPETYYVSLTESQVGEGYNPEHIYFGIVNPESGLVNLQNPVEITQAELPRFFYQITQTQAEQAAMPEQQRPEIAPIPRRVNEIELPGGDALLEVKVGKGYQISVDDREIFVNLSQIRIQNPSEDEITAETRADFEFTFTDPETEKYTGRSDYTVQEWREIIEKLDNGDLSFLEDLYKQVTAEADDGDGDDEKEDEKIEVKQIAVGDEFKFEGWGDEKPRKVKIQKIEPVLIDGKDGESEDIIIFDVEGNPNAVTLTRKRAEWQRLRENNILAAEVVGVIENSTTTPHEAGTENGEPDSDTVVTELEKSIAKNGVYEVEVFEDRLKFTDPSLANLDNLKLAYFCPSNLPADRKFRAKITNVEQYRGNLDNKPDAMVSIEVDASLEADLEKQGNFDQEDPDTFESFKTAFGQKIEDEKIYFRNNALELLRVEDMTTDQDGIIHISALKKDANGRWVSAPEISGREVLDTAIDWYTNKKEVIVENASNDDGGENVVPADLNGRSAEGLSSDEIEHEVGILSAEFQNSKVNYPIKLDSSIQGSNWEQIVFGDEEGKKKVESLAARIGYSIDSDRLWIPANCQAEGRIDMLMTYSERKKLQIFYKIASVQPDDRLNGYTQRGYLGRCFQEANLQEFEDTCKNGQEVVVRNSNNELFVSKGEKNTKDGIVQYFGVPMNSTGEPRVMGVLVDWYVKEGESSDPKAMAIKKAGETLEAVGEIESYGDSEDMMRWEEALSKARDVLTTAGFDLNQAATEKHLDKNGQEIFDNNSDVIFRFLRLNPNLQLDTEILKILPTKSVLAEGYVHGDSVFIEVRDQPLAKEDDLIEKVRAGKQVIINVPRSEGLNVFLSNDGKLMVGTSQDYVSYDEAQAKYQFVDWYYREGSAEAAGQASVVSQPLSEGSANSESENLKSIDKLLYDDPSGMYIFSYKDGRVVRFKEGSELVIQNDRGDNNGNVKVVNIDHSHRIANLLTETGQEFSFPFERLYERLVSAKEDNG